VSAPLELPTGVDSYAERLKQITTGANGALDTRPGLVKVFADSNASMTDVRRAAGFLQAMDVATQARLARQSGAKLELSARHRALAQGIGENTSDVQATPQKDDGDVSFWGKVWDGITSAAANTGDFLFNNPVADGFFTLLDAPLNVLKTGYRMISSGMDTKNDDEINQSMQEQGYDTSSLWDNIQFFWGNGESAYHDTSDLRDKYGSQQVDLARQMQRDPQEFWNELGTRSAEEQQAVMKSWKDADFQKLYEEMDHRHISVGRDIARGFDLDGAAFTAVSGGLDAAAAWFADPLLILGKAKNVGKVFGVEVGAAKVNKYTIQNALDADGVRKLLATDEAGNATTRVGQGWQLFLDDAKQFRDARDKGDEALQGAIYARMDARHKDLMPLLDEINGKHVLLGEPVRQGDHVLTNSKVGKVAVREQDPIENLHQLSNYLAGNAALTRISMGVEANGKTMMPGIVSWRQERQAQHAFNRTLKGQARFEESIDYTRPDRIVPVDEDAEVAQMMNRAEAAGESIKESYGKTWLGWKNARSRFERMNRRVTTFLPTVRSLDYTSAEGVEQVRRFARLYLPKHEADRIAGVYAGGTVGERRNVVKGMMLETFHAAGLSRSVEGRKFMDKLTQDTVDFESVPGIASQKYGHGGTDILHDAEAGDRRVGLHPTQMIQSTLLPSFQELSYAAAKGAVAGKYRAFFYGDSLDRAMAAVKIGWITSAAGGTRNALDELVGVYLKGGGGDMERARVAWNKATQESAAGAKTAKRLDKADALKEKADTAEALGNTRAAARHKAKADRLEQALQHRLPIPFRGSSKRVSDVLLGTVMGRMLSMPVLRGTDNMDELVKYAEELSTLELSESARHVILGTHYSDDLGNEIGEGGAAAMHAKGVPGQRYKYAGHGDIEIEADGGIGTDAWARAMGLRFGTGMPANEALKAITSGQDPVEAVFRRLQGDDKMMQAFRRDSELANTHPMTGRPVVTDEDRLDALHDLAGRISEDTRLLMTGRGGSINSEAARLILEENVIPDRSWLKLNVDEHERPTHAVGALYAPVNAAHIPGQMLEGYTKLLSKAYDVFVNKQVLAISRNPLLTANYAKARKATEGYEQMLTHHGVQADEAASRAKDIALRQAEQMTVKDIDNPVVATQFSVLARNFWAFERAQEDWLRRWGRNLRDKPEVLRKGQLLLEGSEDAGLVERDDNGNLTFVYPGSGALIEALTKLGDTLGIPGVVAMTNVEDLTSRLTFVNPSLDNPIGFSATPVLSTPFRILRGMMPAEAGMFEAGVDRVLNGDLGAGRGIIEGIVPSPIMRIYQGVFNEDPASQFASSARATIANLEAAGLGMPSDATPEQQDLYLSRVRTQTKNHLFLRAILGFFAPAAPSLTEGGNAVVMDQKELSDMGLTPKVLKDRGIVDGQGKPLRADWFYHELGITMLKDQARLDIQNFGFDRARQMWIDQHPDELVFIQGSSTKNEAGGAFMPATLDAATFMTHNAGFMKDYRSIAPYFIPEAPGEYNQVAWNSQLEQGLRQYKGLEDYAKDVVIQRGERSYYDLKDYYDKAISEAKARGAASLARSLDEEWSSVKKDQLAFNPLLKAKFESYGSTEKDQAIQRLADLVQDPNRPKGIRSIDGAADMLHVYYDYMDAKQKLAGERSRTATSRRAVLDSGYETAMKSIVAQYPGLGDFYRGVFRNP
jgi:hypothetical protein